ncbi:dna polymerase iv [hydrocarbon metagenome]|uniref:Dna polymerase iv n=1 Tax=hydrocarbon metagenome TaxID=938273 RepID=A0A0W8EN38_9ZZZZ
MPISRAYQLCPDAVFLPPDFDLYARVSSSVMEILKRHSGIFEQVSIDEAFLDLSDLGSYSAAQEVGERIKAEIISDLKITCSIGIAPGRILAKIASDSQKPNGLTVLTPGETRGFLAPLPVEKIPGIGKWAAHELHRLGITTIGDLAAADIQQLIGKFGRRAADLRALARGCDERGVQPRTSSRSVSRETTFEGDTGDPDLLLQTLDTLASDLSIWCDENRVSFRTISVKVRYQGFLTRTRAKTLATHTAGGQVIRGVARELFSGVCDGRDIRLIGIRLAGLRSGDRHQKTIDEFCGSLDP